MSAAGHERSPRCTAIAGGSDSPRATWRAFRGLARAGSTPIHPIHRTKRRMCAPPGTTHKDGSTAERATRSVTGVKSLSSQRVRIGVEPRARVKPVCALAPGHAPPPGRARAPTAHVQRNGRADRCGKRIIEPRSQDGSGAFRMRAETCRTQQRQSTCRAHVRRNDRGTVDHSARERAYTLVTTGMLRPARCVPH